MRLLDIVESRGFPQETVKRLDRPSEFRFSAEEFLCIGLRCSNLRGWIYDDEIYAEAVSALPLPRLEGVRCLALLSAVSSTGQPDYLLDFLHRRFGHSLVVAKVMETILRRSNVSEMAVKKGIIGGLLHDIATPALGDPVMSIDPPNLNEEDWWHEVIEDEEGQEGRDFLRRHGIIDKDIDEIIHNKGYLGQVLDIADRITYVGDDAFVLIGPPDLSPYEGTIDPYFEDIWCLIQNKPNVCDIYREVEVDPRTETVFFNNTEKLFDFLKLRALLTTKLYLHPLNKARDHLLVELMAPLYTPFIADHRQASEGRLTPHKLRRMTDEDLIRYLNAVYLGPSSSRVCFSFVDINHWPARYKKFDSVEEATQFRDELRTNKDIVLLGDVKVVKGFNSAVSYLVKTGKGELKPYYEVDPKGAEEIGVIEKASRGIYVLYVNQTESSDINILLRRREELLELLP